MRAWRRTEFEIYAWKTLACVRSFVRSFATRARRRLTTDGWMDEWIDRGGLPHTFALASSRPRALARDGPAFRSTSSSRASPRAAWRASVERRPRARPAARSMGTNFRAFPCARARNLRRRARERRTEGRCEGTVIVSARAWGRWSASARVCARRTRDWRASSRTRGGCSRRCEDDTRSRRAFGRDRLGQGVDGRRSRSRTGAGVRWGRGRRRGGGRSGRARTRSRTRTGTGTLGAKKRGAVMTVR